MFEQRIAYGAAYYDEYMPLSRVEEDMALMEQAGMNIIRIAESTWSTWEPREGEFDFTSLNRVLQAAPPPSHSSHRRHTYLRDPPLAGSEVPRYSGRDP